MLKTATMLKIRTAYMAKSELQHQGLAINTLAF